MEDCAAPSALSLLSIPKPGLTAGAIHCGAFGAMAWRCSARPEEQAENSLARERGVRNSPEGEARQWGGPAVRPGIGLRKNERRRRGTENMDAAALSAKGRMRIRSRTSLRTRADT